ncbi:hypothetical protein BMF94_5873 [Rhodotorula taiwanensis]|uniref:Dipeptidyl-peptidase IV n=1 Tax=Rhodotorula taiwanensis TaxID=741276 RepID=A0A2S5B2Y7_9BASI|nr:hypothetical protein BMF94_5873 [Rhodotorula taiwanensis]
MLLPNATATPGYLPLSESNEEQHPFPPRQSRPERGERQRRAARFPETRPPLWIPDPFDSAAIARQDELDDDSGEDTAYESEEDGLGEGEKGQLRSETSESKEATDSSDQDDGWEFSLAALQKDRIKRRRRLLVLFPAFLVLTLFFILALVNLFGPSSGHHRFYGAAATKKRMTLDEVLNGTFAVQTKRVEWVALAAEQGGEVQDGLYTERRFDGSILLHDPFHNSSRVLLAADDIRGTDGARLLWYRHKFSADGMYALVDSHWTKVWRHSTLANFYLHRLPSDSNAKPASSPTRPIRTPHSPPGTSFAHFSPTSHHLAYVHANDLYVLPAETIDADPEGKGWEGDAIRVTSDGTTTRMSGRPSWVYEEEVFSSDSTLWWSPTSAHVAFITFDESDVPLYKYPIYNASPASPAGEVQYEGWEYPKEVGLRYPKPGYSNPLITVRVFSLSHYRSLSSDSSLSSADRLSRSLLTLRLARPFNPDDQGEVVTEVAWIGPDEVLVRMTDRSARVERVGRFDLSAVDWERMSGSEDEVGNVLEGEVVRETDWWQKDGGWAEAAQTIVSLSSASAANGDSYAPGYLDLVPDAEGFVHVAYYSPDTTSDAVFLTSGEWEVDAIDRVDLARGLIYFTAARPSIARHVYFIPLPRNVGELAALRTGKSKRAEPTLLPGQGSSDSTKEVGTYSVTFSALAGSYWLSYRGPGIPWQKLYKIDDPDTPQQLTGNRHLAETDAAYLHPTISYSTERLEDGGTGSGEVEVNVMELRPPLMDESGRTKYPVLFQIYGGPNSQMVSTQFQRDFQHYLATSLDYVVVRVDARGTGFQGRKFRSTVRGRLGEVERRDVIEVARRWAEKAYVDEKRVGVWGWSYGGFLTSKIIEANSTVFSLGMAVAPVTDWRLYDTLYTERYMGLPDANPGGYRNSSIHEMDGFRHADFALAHGSGDDNVHFQNTALLLDRFTMAGVRNFRFRMFTDSDHSIMTRSAYGELLRWLEGFLLERFGHGGRTKGRWKMRKDPSGNRAPFGPGEHDFGEKS